MSAHALLSPSSASRWLSCPASVAHQGDGDDSSAYAEEGTHAHRFAELEARHRFGQVNHTTYARDLVVLIDQADDNGWDSSAMRQHAEEYADLLENLGDGHAFFAEQRVDPRVPSCWGTADASLVGVDDIHIVDYKYGQGVRVDAEMNPQLMLYGVGALEDFGIGQDTIRMTVHQPRLGHTDTFTVSAEFLIAWRDTVVLPAAAKALSGSREYGPSEDACRWCPISGQCRAQAERMGALDFDIDPDLLSDEEMAEALNTAKETRQWLVDLEKAALDRAYAEGRHLPGWKVVRSGGRRSVPDVESALGRLKAAGFSASRVSRVQLETLGNLEKTVGGPGALHGILGDLIVKSEGKESLVPESDRRDEISPAGEAAKDFLVD